MADVKEVLKPGQRITDSTGAVASGATLEFYEAGTSTPREVFSDYALSTSLGVEVTTDSAGYPTSDGSAKVNIYTGPGRYKIVCKASNDTVLWSVDQIPGALDTSGFQTAGSTLPAPAITNTANPATLEIGNQGNYLNVNCSGGDVTITLDTAADLGNGWFCKVRHDGSANQVLIVGTGGELFKVPAPLAGVTSFALSHRGQVVTITCDGAEFKVEESSPALFNTTGIIIIADRLNTPPSAEAGARYIVTSGATGAWSGYSQHDIAEADGAGGWFRYTPPTDCGWVAFVQDEDFYYSFVGSAWIATGGQFVPMAVQADMEAATAGKVVTAGVQHFHPGHPKCWAYVTVSGGTPTLQTSYNITSITDAGTGLLTLTIANDFSSANWAPFATVASNDEAIVMYTNIAAGSVQLTARSDTGTSLDPPAWSFLGMGDL
jgi:hypothetical protein